MRARAASLSAVLLAGLLLLASPTAYSQGASVAKPSLNVGLHVLTIIFDPSGKLLRGLHNETASFTVDCNAVSITLHANITYLKAPRWALDALVGYMERNYKNLGVPSWAKAYAREHNLTVRWLELRPFYERLWDIVRGIIIRDYHFTPNDIVAVIGDVDGVSRQYYEKPLGPLKTGRLEGVRGWVGEHPLAFYDLTVIPKPWPTRTIPFYGVGVPVDAEHEPPLWSLADPSGYVRRLVLDHIRFHYLTLCPISPWYSRTFRVHVVVVDYGNETVTRTVMGMLNTSLIRELIRMMDPWVNVTVAVEAVRPTAGSPLAEILEHARLEGGWLVLYFRDVARLIAADAAQRFPLLQPCNSAPVHRACDFVFYILATPKPSYMRFESSGMNFTGFGGGWLGATSYPGYGYRVVKGTLVRVVAHEAGHAIGLLHPFQLYNNTIRWLMDFIETPMSYYDEGGAYYRYGDTSPYEAFKTALIHLAALMAAYNLTKPPESVAGLLAAGRPDMALHTLLTLLPSQRGGGHRASPTRTETPTITITVTYTRPVTVPQTVTVTVQHTHTITVASTVTAYRTVTLTETLYTTVTRTVTATETVTSTTTATVTAERTVTVASTSTVTVTVAPTPETVGAVAVALLVGLAVGYLAARRGRSP